MNAVNERLTDAYVREDVETLRGMLMEEHVHNNVFGAGLGREEFLRDIESGVLVFETYETPELEWFVDGDVAVATGLIEARAVRGGRPVPAERFRFSRVFVRVGGEWKVLLFQNTMAG